MSSKADEIMGAAERRPREGGCNGFSFRDLAASAGIKSAKVHHHFPTKAALAAAMAQRYANRFLKAVEEQSDGAAVAVGRDVFRRALTEGGRKCLCGVWEPRPARSVWRAHGGLSGAYCDTGLRVLATLEGAMLVARALDDPAAFDQATAGLA